MGDQLIAGGGILSKVQVGVARISSQDRIGGTYNDFTVMLKPQISRCIGFFVQSIIIHNDWYTIDEFHNTSYWSTDGGTTIVPVTVTPGYYDGTTTATNNLADNTPGKLFAAVLQAAIRLQVAGAANATITYDGNTNLLTMAGDGTTDLAYYSGNNATESLQTAFSTMGPILGFSNGQFSTGSADPTAAADSLVLDRFDPPYVDINSYQLRQPQGFDTRLQGGTNAFLHMRIDTPKLTLATYLNLAPSDYNVIKFPGPQEFQLLNFFVTNPKTGDKMDMGRNWEMVLYFLCVAGS